LATIRLVGGAQAVCRLPRVAAPLVAPAARHVLNVRDPSVALWMALRNAGLECLRGVHSLVRLEFAEFTS
jgi:hypothetical protein